MDKKKTLIIIVLAFVLLMAGCLLIPAAPAAAASAKDKKLPGRKLALYAALTVLALLALAKVIPDWALAAAVVVLLLIFDRPVLRQVEQPVLL